MNEGVKECKKLAGKLRWRAVLLRKIAIELDTLAAELLGMTNNGATGDSGSPQGRGRVKL